MSGVGGAREAEAVQQGWWTAVRHALAGHKPENLPGCRTQSVPSGGLIDHAAQHPAQGGPRALIVDEATQERTVLLNQG